MPTKCGINFLITIRSTINQSGSKFLAFKFANGNVHRVVFWFRRRNVSRLIEIKFKQNRHCFECVCIVVNGFHYERTYSGGQVSLIKATFLFHRRSVCERSFERIIVQQLHDEFNKKATAQPNNIYQRPIECIRKDF